MTTELDYGNHPSSLPHEGGILDKVCADVAFGRALVFDLGSAADIRGLRISPLAVALKPKLRIVHDLTFARAGGRTSVGNHKTFSKLRLASSAAWFATYSCGFYPCVRHTTGTLG